jgi:hypothetical protein
MVTHRQNICLKTSRGVGKEIAAPNDEEHHQILTRKVHMKSHLFPCILSLEIMKLNLGLRTPYSKEAVRVTQFNDMKIIKKDYFRTESEIAD